MIKIICNQNLLCCFLFLSLLLAGFEREFQTQLILAESGDTLKIPRGKQQLLGTLSLDGKENIVIIGTGVYESILSFKNQEIGIRVILNTQALLWIYFSI